MDRSMDEQIVWIDTYMDGQMDRSMDEQMDGQIDQIDRYCHDDELRQCKVRTFAGLQATMGAEGSLQMPCDNNRTDEQEQMRQEQMRQELMRQELMRQEQMRQEQMSKNR